MLKRCLQAGLFGLPILLPLQSADAEVMTFRCDVVLHWAKAPIRRLVVVDTDALSIHDGTLLWQDRHSNPPGDNQTQHVTIGQTVIEWGSEENGTQAAVDNYRIDLSTGLYRYDNALRGMGKGRCKRVDLVS